MAAHDPLAHVVDHDTLELFWPFVPTYQLELHLPKIPIVDFQITRFMVMELIAAALALAILIPTVRHIRRNQVTKGGFFNAVEAILLFIRDEVARPAIGGHGADKFLPFLWTAFFFVLISNLLGMIPGFASSTGNINVTAVLALSTLGVVVWAGMKEYGVKGFFVNLVPHVDVPKPLSYVFWPLMFVIELMGLLIKHLVLAVRLFANMFAGHVVLAVILGFITMASGWLFYVVTPASIAGVVALSLLELFVAFLQAYVFTFLSAIFIGSAVHSH